MMKSIALSLMLLLIAPPSASPAAPAPDTALKAAIEALARHDMRVATIGYRLATANAARCAVLQPQTGLLIHAREQYGLAAQAVLDGPGTDVTVLGVVPGSAAAAAAIEAGDAIVAVNGKAVPRATETAESYVRVAATLDLIDAAAGAGPVTFDLMRDGAAVRVTVKPQPACASRFQVVPDREVNASADGALVTVTSALADYASEEGELAVVVAHELAHNILGHRARLDAAKVSRGFFGRFGRNAARIRETEIEADRMSVALLATAGYDPRAAIGFYTRFDKDHGHGIFAAATHLRGTKRTALIESEIARIENP